MELPNFDINVGLSYGVISQHSIMPEVLSDLTIQAEDLYYNEAKEEFETDLKDAIREVLNNYITYIMENMNQ